MDVKINMNNGDEINHMDVMFFALTEHITEKYPILFCSVKMVESKDIMQLVPFEYPLASVKGFLVFE